MISVNQHLLAAIKRTAKNSNIYHKKMAALQKKIDALVEEYNDYNRIYESWEQPVRKMTNGLSSRECLEIIAEGRDLNQEIGSRRFVAQEEELDAMILMESSQALASRAEIDSIYSDVQPSELAQDLEHEAEQQFEEELKSTYSENQPSEEDATHFSVKDDKIIQGHPSLPEEYYNENL